MPPQNNIGQDSASDHVHQVALALGGQGELPVEVDDTHPLPVKVMSGGGGGSGGTEYTEDSAAPADPVGGVVLARRRDTLSASEVSTDGDVIALNATNKGELHTSDSDMLAKSEAIRGLLAGVLGISAASLPLPTNAATSGNQASELTKLDTLHTDLIAATPAGENHIGAVGGDTIVATATLTVTASSAYATGNVIGGKLTFTGFGRVTGGTGAVQMAAVDSKAVQTGAVDLVLFHTDPSSSTFTDKTALAVAAADFDKIIDVIHITDWTSLGTPSFAKANNLGIPYKVATGASDIYGVLVARSTPTFASTSDLKVVLKGFRD